MGVRRAPGIYETAPSTFKVVVSAGRDDDGRYRQVAKVLRGATLSEAKKARAAMLTELGNGSRVPGHATAVAEMADRYLDHLSVRGRAATTVESYATVLRTHVVPTLGTKAVGKVTAADLNNLYSKLAPTHQPKTIARVHLVANGLFKLAQREGLIGTNPAAKAEPPALHRREPTAPTMDEMASLLEAADDDFRTMLILGAVTGMRRGELCGLTWSDVDLVNATVRVSKVIVTLAGKAVVKPTTKTYRARSVSIDAGTLDLLRAHRDRCGERAAACGAVLRDDCFLFSPRPGNVLPHRPNFVTVKFARLARSVGVDGYAFKDATRHLSATHLIANGVDPVTAARRLGHKNPSVTLDVYAAHVPQQDQVAANVIGALVTRL